LRRYSSPGAAPDMSTTDRPSPVAQGSTKPHLASTPFAAEVQDRNEAQRRTRAVAAFVVAAASIVGGIWYFTGEERVIAGDSADTTPPSAATAVTAPGTAVTASTTSTTHAASRGGDPVGQPPSQGGDANPQPTAAGGAGQVVPTEPLPELPSAQPPDASGQALASSPTRAPRVDSVPVQPVAKVVTDKRAPTPPVEPVQRRVIKRNPPRSEPDVTTSDLPALRNDAPANPTPTHRARSGSLNVNEF
ncbi:MAG: hypothetical protein ABW321_01810, partial [Polyangiales bacterium]